MNTLGNETKTKAVIQESYGVALGFPATSAISVGQLVVLGANGEVDKVSASTDTPVGVVAKGAAVGENATVITQFCAVLNVTAHADVVTGNEVSVHEYDATNLTDKYKPSAAADSVVGVALADATAGNEFEVGILRVPYTKS